MRATLPRHGPPQAPRPPPRHRRSRHERHVVISDVRATGPGTAIAGINANYGDTATLSGLTITGDSGRDTDVCARFEGNDSGDEPSETGSGPDGTHCRYRVSDITYS